MKLYPPVIPNKIPAFTNNFIKVPFTNNIVNNQQDINGAIILFRKTYNNQLITKQNEPLQIDVTIDYKNSIIIFENFTRTLTESLVPGEYYKIQVAFVNKDQNDVTTIGYYSNIGTVKYTTQPKIYIKNLVSQDSSSINRSSYMYEGICEQGAGSEIQDFVSVLQKFYFGNYLNYDYIVNNYENIYPTLINEYSSVAIASKELYNKFQEQDFGSYLKIFAESTEIIQKLFNEATTIEQLQRSVLKILLDDISFAKEKIEQNFGGIMFFTELMSPKYYQDASEKLYSYYFNLYDSDQETILDTSGILLNENTNNIPEDLNSKYLIAYNTWYSTLELKPYKNYYLKYGGTTINGLEVSSDFYLIQTIDTIDLDINANFNAILDYENGCIDLSLTPDASFNSMIKYNFLICRASNKDNYQSWEPLCRDLKELTYLEVADVPDFHIWTDYTIEQGVSYIYSLQAYNKNNIYSNRIYSNRIKYTQQEKEKQYESYLNMLQKVSTGYGLLKDYINNYKLYDTNQLIELQLLNSYNNFYNYHASLVFLYENYIIEQKWDRFFEQDFLFSTQLQKIKKPLNYSNDQANLDTFSTNLEILITLLQEKIDNWDENEIYGEPIPVLANFEHAFLFDGKRQLKIAFNPKISSFKNTILESKVDTLGNKYPFFFRNGKISYKEFSISGLISYLMDKDDKFFTNINNVTLRQTNSIGEEFIIDDCVGDTQLTSTNFYKERNFKLEVLNWLNNGQPKIFRSPAEGNYIIRLMNVSLTPNDTLGRMLHSFQATAYEIADYDFKHLREYGFVDINLSVVDTTTVICQKELNNSISLINFPTKLNYIKCEITDPSQEEVELHISQSGTASVLPEIIKFKSMYVFPQSVCKYINSITVIPKRNKDNELIVEPVLVTWAYEEAPLENAFNYIDNIIPKQEFLQLIAGGNYFNPIQSTPVQSIDIISELINNSEREMGQLNYLKIYRRPIEDCWYGIDQQFYQQSLCLTKETFDYADSLIYRVHKDTEVYYYWKDQRSGEFITMDEESFNNSDPYIVEINNKKISLASNEIRADNKNLLKILKADKYMEQTPDNQYYYPITTETKIEGTGIDLNNIHTLKVGIGLNVEMYYYFKIFEYNTENSQQSIINYNNFVDSLQQIKDEIKNSDQYNPILVQEYRTLYEDYLIALNILLSELRGKSS